MRKKLLALLLAAAMALSLLAGCGGGESAASALLKLLDGRYPNISIEIDPELEADLRQAIRKAEAENAGDDAAVIRAALETALGSTITFRYLGEGQKGDTAFDLVFYAGSDPDKAAQAAYSQWNLVFANVPDDGKYDTSLAMVETNSGVWMLVKATVEKAGTVDKPDTDDDPEPEPGPDPTEVGYEDDDYSVTWADEKNNQKLFTVKTTDGLEAWADYVLDGNWNTDCTLNKDITIDSDWTPIGSYNNGFTGTFDGGNHTITMDGTRTQGLFNYIGDYSNSTGTVKDLTINVGTISGDGNGGVGAVAGSNYGTIQNCDVTGGTIQSSQSGYGPVGGIVGSNHTNGKIIGCSSAAAVKDGQQTGGIAGYNNGNITACYSTGTVTGTTVPGATGSGGVVGISSQGTVTACYHAGTVQGSGVFSGGVVGWNDVGTVTACYWSGQVDGGNGIGLDTDGKYSSTTSLEHNKYFGNHDNMVDSPNDWTAALAGLNSQSTGYTFGGTDMNNPSLTKTNP